MQTEGVVGRCGYYDRLLSDCISAGGGIVSEECGIYLDIMFGWCGVVGDEGEDAVGSTVSSCVCCSL